MVQGPITIDDGLHQGLICYRTDIAPALLRGADWIMRHVTRLECRTVGM